MVAQALNYIYVDTGAMYRAVTWKILKLGISEQETDAIIEHAAHFDIMLLPAEDGQRVFIDDEDVTSEVRKPDVTKLVSKV